MTETYSVTPFCADEPDVQTFPLPDGVTIHIDWHGQPEHPITTVGKLSRLLGRLAPETPIFVILTENGDLDHLQIGGEAPWLG